MLQVEAVHKSFGDFTAVYGANLTVENGELVAVIGPNGAGKTTLFNLISGQLKLDKGKIVFKGEEISGLPPYDICKRGIGRSFQIVNIFHRLTVFENVQVAVLSHQRLSSNLFSPAQKLAVEETNRILESVGLADKASNIAGSLSHGDQKILEIAIALGNEPELLILDEPTAGMSPEETAATLALTKQLASPSTSLRTGARGLTILFCEHDMEVVFDIAQSIMVMHHGQTLIQGKPEEVRRNEEVQDAYLGGVEIVEGR
jgi:branched-chain amino acid transport system ATP-binding protein